MEFVEALFKEIGNADPFLRSQCWTLGRMTVPSGCDEKAKMKSLENSLKKEGWTCALDRSAVAYGRFSKFTIAFENATTKYYISEKSATALIAGSIPIIYGCPELRKLWSEKCVIFIPDLEKGVKVAAKVTWQRMQEFLSMSCEEIHAISMSSPLADDLFEWFTVPPFKSVVVQLTDWLKRQAA